MSRAFVAVSLTFILVLPSQGQATAPLGPAQARIDATTQDSFDKSLEHVQASIAPDEREKFEQAWIILMSDAVEKLGEVPEDVALGMMMKTLHGKSAPEVISEAEGVVRRMLDDEQRRLAKATLIDVPPPTAVVTNRVWTCDARSARDFNSASAAKRRGSTRDYAAVAHQEVRSRREARIGLRLFLRSEPTKSHLKAPPGDSS